MKRSDAHDDFTLNLQWSLEKYPRYEAIKHIFAG